MIIKRIDNIRIPESNKILHTMALNKNQKVNL